MIRTTADFETAKANGEVWPVGDAAGKHWTDGFAVYNEAGENVGYITAQEPGLQDMTSDVVEAASFFTMKFKTIAQSLKWVGATALTVFGLNTWNKTVEVVKDPEGKNALERLAIAVGGVVALTGVVAVGIIYARKKWR